MNPGKKYSVRNIVNEIEHDIKNKDIIKLVNKIIDDRIQEIRNELKGTKGETGDRGEQGAKGETTEQILIYEKGSKWGPKENK